MKEKASTGKISQAINKRKTKATTIKGKQKQQQKKENQKKKKKRKKMQKESERIKLDEKRSSVFRSAFGEKYKLMSF